MSFGSNVPVRNRAAARLETMCWDILAYVDALKALNPLFCGNGGQNAGLYGQVSLVAYVLMFSAGATIYASCSDTHHVPVNARDDQRNVVSR